jgi:hypothetical protein
VLVIHALRPTSRQTTIDHLLAFREHLPQADVQYLHFAQPLPKQIAEGVAPDLLIVNYDYLNYRFSPLWPYLKNRHRDIARRSRHVVAIAQDDFWAHRLLDNWCMSWDVDRVLTPIDNDLDILYPRTIEKAEFKTVLTGYAPTKAPITPPLAERPIDLGQRVRTMPAHLGKHAQAKSNQAVQFAAAARSAGFNVDVSARVEDSLVGAAWPEFLTKCKFTVGMKGGASIADPYGLLYTKVESIRLRQPNRHVTSESLRFLRRRDGKHMFTAISPRLFEAAAAGTCQVLRPDNYMGVLEPWVHYLPLSASVVHGSTAHQLMNDLERAQEIAYSSRDRLIKSGEFSYKRLVDAATSDYALSSLDSSSQGWVRFRAYLERAGEPCIRKLFDVHDAALYSLQSKTGRGTFRASRTIVSSLLAMNQLERWLKEWEDNSKQDPFVLQIPWLPRLLPAA